MLNRQKTTLEFLKAAARPVLGTEMTKWSFLLRHEYASNGEKHQKGQASLMLSKRIRDKETQRIDSEVSWSRFFT